MSTSSFVGAGLSVESVSQLALVTLRVKFTQDPLAVSSVGANDALNPANYSVSSTNLVGIVTGVGAVYGDPQSFDLFLAAPVTTGIWTVTASSAIQTAGGVSIQAPLSAQVAIVSGASIEPVSGGAENDTAFDTLRKFFNPALKGPAWDALLKACADNQQVDWDNAQAAFQQLFLTRAEGKCLLQRAADRGVYKPANVGMSDDIFRQFALTVSNRKLTEEAILEVLEVFYGSDAIRASDISGAVEPYALQEGDDLIVVLDESVTVTATFLTSDFARAGQAQAVEVAAALTRAFSYYGTKAFALPIVDVTSGTTRVRIYSPSRGLKSSVRTIGGKAQSALLFSTQLSLASTASNSFPTWNVTVNGVEGTMRFTTSGASNLDLSGLRIGDYVNIYGSQFQPVNRGSFAITDVGISYTGTTVTQYFEVSNTAATAQSAIAQTASTDILYFRPTRQTIHTATSRGVSVSVPAARVDIKLPATSLAVSRGPNLAAYSNQNPALPITTLTRLNGTVTAVVPAHNMQVGDWFIVDDAVGSMTAPTANAGDSTHTSYSIASVWSSFSPAGATRYWNAVAKLLDGRVLITGGFTNGVGSSSATDLFTVVSSATIGSATQYTVSNIVDAASDANRCTANLVTLNGTGKVLLFGGTNFGGTYASTSRLYTPGSIGSGGTWGSSASTISSLAGRSSVQRTDNIVMAIGGTGGTTGSTAVEAYDPTANTWTARAAMNIGRCQAKAVQLNDGTVLVAGGRVSGFTLDFATLADIGICTNTAEVYTVGSNTWAQVGRMSYARTGHALYVLSDGRVIAIGGIGYNPSQSTTAAYLNTTEVYDPTMKLWVPGPSMRVARGFFASDVINNRVYVAGGNPTDASTEYLDLATMRWTYVPAALSSPVTKTRGVATAGLLVTSYGLNVSTGTNLRVLTPGADTFSSAGLNGYQQVASVVSGSTFTFTTERQGYTVAAGGTVTPCKAKASVVPGPHVYDLEGSVALTSTSAKLNQTIASGHQYPSLQLDTLSGTDPTPALRFPDKRGWLCIAFGYSNQVTAIPYLGRLSDTALALDYSFVFPADIAPGATVNLLANRGAYTPDAPEEMGSFYLTDSPAGRLGAQTAIDSIVGAGLTVNTQVIYPGDRGLGNEGAGTSGSGKVSDIVSIFGTGEDS